MEPVNLDEEFDFYIKFAKPLVLNLPKSDERVRAASWIQALRSTKDPPELRNNYLKLLLFALQRHNLAGPFGSLPPATLEPFPEGQVLSDIARSLIELDKTETKPIQHDEIMPYVVETSSDLREYSAAQMIPNFGVHCYYATSQQPLCEWENVDLKQFPPRTMSVTAAERGMWASASPMSLSSPMSLDLSEDTDDSPSSTSHTVRTTEMIDSDGHALSVVDITQRHFLRTMDPSDGTLMQMIKTSTNRSVEPTNPDASSSDQSCLCKSTSNIHSLSRNCDPSMKTHHKHRRTRTLIQQKRGTCRPNNETATGYRSRNINNSGTERSFGPQQHGQHYPSHQTARRHRMGDYGEPYYAGSEGTYTPESSLYSSRSGDDTNYPPDGYKPAGYQWCDVGQSELERTPQQGFAGPVNTVRVPATPVSRYAYTGAQGPYQTAYNSTVSQTPPQCRTVYTIEPDSYQRDPCQNTDPRLWTGSPQW